MNSINQYKDKGYNFISISQGNFKVILCDLAASLYQVYLDDNPMLVESPEFTKANKHFGRTIGRVAGRLPGTITINNKQYKLANNEGVNTLHGGIDGISNQVFDLVEINNSTYITTVTYQYLSKDGQSGFNGNMLLKVIYEIDSLNKAVKITFNSKCDKDCPININNHTYFNLGDKNIDNLRLQIKADKFISPNGSDMMPLETKPIISCLDFNKLKLIKKDINDREINYGKLHGYDHYFIFNKIDTKYEQAILTNDWYYLRIFTDYPGLQFYSDQPNFRGVALEAQNITNDFDAILVKANTEVEHWVKFMFGIHKRIILANI